MFYDFDMKPFAYTLIYNSTLININYLKVANKLINNITQFLLDLSIDKDISYINRKHRDLIVQIISYKSE